MSLKVEWFKDLEGLPSLPGQILKALDEIDKTSALDYNILQLIQNDAPIALRVLKLANAPIYGYASQISSLQQAVGLLGPQAIKNVILTTSILERFGDYGRENHYTDYAKLWIHAAVTGALAGFLGRKHGGLEQDVCFTAGLIHDAGKIALAAYYPDSLKKILKLAEREKLSVLQASREVLGFPYPEITAQMAENWKFPGPLIGAFRNLGRMDTEEIEDSLTGVICLAKCLTFQLGYPDGMEKVKPVMTDSLFKLLGFHKNDLKSWEPQLKNQAVEAFHAFDE